jgi:trans-2,3-dihydro-3-hydroxyanthranilate isomerase
VTTELPKVIRATPSRKERRSIRIKQVDAFSDIPLTGNPAGVVPDAGGLVEDEMLLVAREMSLPETAFILPSSDTNADLRIRWFTPQMEVPLCGHATIASFHALAEDGAHGMGGPGIFHFRLETNSGILPVTVQKTANDVEVFFGLPVPSFTRAAQYKLDLMRILNINFDDFETRLPIMTANYLYVPLRRLHTLFSLRPNYFSMNQFLANRNLIGLCVFST